jgi:hypothetical protein
MLEMAILRARESLSVIGSEGGMSTLGNFWLSSKGESLTPIFCDAFVRIVREISEELAAILVTSLAEDDFFW